MKLFNKNKTKSYESKSSNNIVDRELDIVESRESNNIIAPDKIEPNNILKGNNNISTQDNNTSNNISIQEIIEVHNIIKNIPSMLNIRFFTYNTHIFLIHNQETADIVCKWHDTLKLADGIQTCTECNFTIKDCYIIVENLLGNLNIKNNGLNETPKNPETPLKYSLVPLSVVFNEWQNFMDKTLPFLPQEYIDRIPKNVKDFYTILNSVKKTENEQNDVKNISKNLGETFDQIINLLQDYNEEIIEKRVAEEVERRTIKEDDEEVSPKKKNNTSKEENDVPKKENNINNENPKPFEKPEIPNTQENEIPNTEENQNPDAQEKKVLNDFALEKLLSSKLVTPSMLNKNEKNKGNK